MLDLQVDSIFTLTIKCPLMLISNKDVSLRQTSLFFVAYLSQAPPIPDTLTPGECFPKPFVLAYLVFFTLNGFQCLFLLIQIVPTLENHLNSQLFLEAYSNTSSQQRYFPFFREHLFCIMILFSIAIYRALNGVIPQLFYMFRYCLHKVVSFLRAQTKACINSVILVINKCAITSY